MPPHPASNMSDPMQPQMMNDAHDDIQDGPLRRGKDSKGREKKPRPPAGGSRRSAGGSRSRKKKDKEGIEMDDDGELSLEKPVVNDSLILDPITGTMVPNPEAIPDPEGASTPPGFEGGLDSKSSRPKFKSNTPRKPKPNKTLLQFAKKKRKRSDSDDDYGDDFEYEES